MAATESLDRGSAALIDSSIAALESISSKPMIAQIPWPDEQGELVPIESLLYRGRAALDRAIEIRDQIRGGSPTLTCSTSCTTCSSWRARTKPR